ncbi:MAG: hypothetical protein KJO69_06530 [Gammaproteobacteria bacterium]|nr:hypothetical protein [Gammaproteobacteria bacterium]
MSNTTTVKKRGRPATKTTRTERPRRVPMSGQRMRMHIEEEDKDPNYHYGWINDTSGLIQRAKRAGYENVLVSEIPSWGELGVDSANSTSSVISMKVGPDTTAYLMKQPMEYYEEDQAATKAITDSREADMKKELNSRQEGTYGKVEFS